jgi:hypothetical protein
MPEITYMDDDEFQKICSAEGFKKNKFSDCFQIINNNGIIVEWEPIKIRYNQSSEVVTYSYEEYYKGTVWYQLLSSQLFSQYLKETFKMQDE